MSLIWIKNNKEEHTHSIYSDGILTNGFTTIISNDNAKIQHFNFPWFSILIGIVGEQHASSFILSDFERRANLEDTLYNIDGKKHICKYLANMFERIGEAYKQGYGDYPCNQTVALSINGHLFKLRTLKEKKWVCFKTNDSFITAGEGSPIANALLYYDENIDPQKLLDAVSKVETDVNTNLMKIENVGYKEKERK